MSSNGTHFSKIIKFEDATPITVIFDGRRGIEGEACESQWGESQWKHWVNSDSQLIYLPGAAQKRLEESGAQKGDWVAIEKVRGGKNQVWKISIEQPFSDRAELGRRNYLDQKRTEPESPRIVQPFAPIEEEEPKRTRRPPATKKPPAEVTPIAPAATQIPITAAAVLMDMSRPEAKQMASALFNAIDAIAVGQAYARSKELGITFTSEDVRAFAITAYINATKRETR